MRRILRVLCVAEKDRSEGNLPDALLLPKGDPLVSIQKEERLRMDVLLYDVIVRKNKVGETTQ